MLPMIERSIEKYAGEFINALLNQRRIRVLVHRSLLEDKRKEAFFITVTNLTLDREFEITSVWFNANPKIPVTQADRPLPKALKPNETWGTWLPVSKLPLGYHHYAFTMVRVMLSNGTLAYSKENVTHPEKEIVPAEEIKFE